MKTQLLLLGCLFSTSVYFAQNEETAIRQWQSRHPEILLIREDRFADMSKEEKALIGNNYILYKDHISLQELQDYSGEKTSSEDGLSTSRLADARYIKQWKAINSDVKIVPRSVYDTAGDQRRAAYDAHSRCMILEGEYLTIEDIRLFEQQH